MPSKSKSTKVTDAGKPWSKKKSPNKPYKLNTIVKSKSFLIVCEGQNTEPEYFKSFPVVTADVATIGLGASKTYLVNYAAELSKREEYKGREIWCVFDMDFAPQISNQKNDFNIAISLAKKLGFKTAYSNDAFELWFLLHYQDVQGQFQRQYYYSRLDTYFGINYDRDGKKLRVCKEFYNKLINDSNACQRNAIIRAEKLHLSHKGNSYCSRNPCTTVYKLVTELNSCIKK